VPRKRPKYTGAGYGHTFKPGRKHWPQKPRAGAVTTSQLLSKVESACWFCPDPIHVGQPIALYVETANSKWWGHAECVSAAKGVSPG